jgi:hypothetical protein
MNPIKALKKLAEELNSKGNQIAILDKEQMINELADFHDIDLNYEKFPQWFEEFHKKLDEYGGVTDRVDTIMERMPEELIIELHQTIPLVHS